MKSNATSFVILGVSVRHAPLAGTFAIVLVVTGASRLPAQSLSSLPVYSVVRAGALPNQAATLATRLNIPAGSFVLTNGEMHFLDPSKFMAPPVLPVTDPVVRSNLLADTINKVPGIPIRFEQLDFAALNSLTVPGSNTAVASFSTSLDAAGLLPQSATPIVTHTMLSAFYTNGGGAVLSASNYLDTQVSYQFSLQGLPVVGPGAQVQVAFGPTGSVSRLLYTTRQLALGPMVALIDPTVASNRAAALFPGFGGQITMQLVYYAPPLSITSVSHIIPFYSCGGSVTVTNSTTGRTSTQNLLQELIPATDDPAYVPSVSLTANAGTGGTQVVASATVTGGLPPYHYAWGGSGTNVLDETGSQLTYTPVRQVARPRLAVAFSTPGSLAISWVDPSALFQLQSASSFAAGSWSPVTNLVTVTKGVSTATVELDSSASRLFRLALANQSVPTTENVVLNIIDANGIFVRRYQPLGVLALPIPPIIIDPTLLIGWGTEAPYDQDAGSGDIASWRNVMTNNPIFGSERYYRGTYVADRTDFMDPPSGDNDQTVDTADITFYAGHGGPWFFSFTALPTGPSTQTNELFFNDVPKPAWGNREAEWFCLLSCQVLQQFEDLNNFYAWQRWGPDFDGLHLMLGFSTIAYWGGETQPFGLGSTFEEVFVHGMIGTVNSWWPYPVTIQQAWFNAADTTCGWQKRRGEGKSRHRFGRGLHHALESWTWAECTGGRPPFV
jgi:hypothetical protein